MGDKSDVIYFYTKDVQLVQTEEKRKRAGLSASRYLYTQRNGPTASWDKTLQSHHMVSTHPDRLDRHEGSLRRAPYRGRSALLGLLVQRTVGPERRVPKTPGCGCTEPMQASRHHLALDLWGSSDKGRSFCSRESARSVYVESHPTVPVCLLVRRCGWMRSANLQTESVQTGTAGISCGPAA